MHWANFSPDDFDQLLELVLYNFAAIVPGSLREREWAEQKRMLESESLAAIGGAVAGIAHDIKTPLIAIGGFSRLVQRVFDREDPSYHRLEIVIGETRRLEDMAKDMLDFARPPELSLCCEDLNELLSESLSIVEEEAWKKKIRLNRSFSDGIPSLTLDSMKMQRVFINLLMNAIQASPEGETVTVRTRQCGRNALVDIVDCGCGIPPDKREAVFTPFFTTKKEGTGLGLAIVKKIVEAHYGKVDIYQTQPRGAAFQVLLPLDVKRVLRPPKGDVLH